MAFDIDGAEGTGGAEVLACTTADATFHVDDGYLAATIFHVTSALLLGSGAFAFEGNHLDGTRGAVAFAVAAGDLVGEHDAVFAYPDGMANLSR